MADTPQPGEGVDSDGRAVIDPTKNVLDLVKAAVERLNDLREAQEKFLLSELSGLKTNVDTKFDGIESRLQANEARRIESKEDNQKSLDAALSAAKEAVKEQATTSKETTTQQNQTFTAQLGGVERSVADLKERLDRGDGRGAGQTDQRSESRSNVGMIAVVLGAIYGLVMTLIAVAAMMKPGQ
jgi:LPS O-antigen subunit length determinant protein (WzzB/FepE family)